MTHKTTNTHLPPEPDTIWTHLNNLRYYGEAELARKRLRFVAKHFDEPTILEHALQEWLSEQETWNYGNYGNSYAGGYNYGFNYFD